MEMLLESGPVSSAELAKKLMEEGVSSVAARQRIHRAKPPVKKLEGIQLPGRQKFVYLESQFGTPGFYASLTAVLEDSGSAYGVFINGLKARGGMIRKEFSPIASGLPVLLAKKQVLHETALSGLKKAKIVSEYEVPSGQILEISTAEIGPNRYRAMEFVDGIILSAMKDWLVKLNFSSQNALKIRELGMPLPQYRQFHFDFVGPSYLTAFQVYGRKAGFIAGDIILHKELSVSDISPFLKKIDIVHGQKSGPILQAFLIADGFSKDALDLLRTRGVVLATPTSVFGPELGKAIKSLVDMLENAAAIIANNPDELFQLLARLQKIQGVALNLTGVVLELIIAQIYQSDGYWIDIRQKVSSKFGRAEIDIKAKNTFEVVCCECKGMSAGNLVSESEIRKWLDGPFMRIKDWIKESETLPSKKRFVFYSSTGYSPEARKVIEEVETKHIKQSVQFLTGEDILQDLRKRNFSALVEIFKEQFCN